MVYSGKEELIVGVRYHCQVTTYQPEIVRRIIQIVEKNAKLVYAHLELFMKNVKKYVTGKKSIAIIEQFVFKKVLDLI